MTGANDPANKSSRSLRFEATPPLDSRERRKRRREAIAILFLVILFVGLTVAEFRLTKLSAVLPFVNSIFFFGLLNFNIIILIALVWLVFRNLGKLFIERRRRLLGSRLKSKLVISFLSLSIVPTLVLFAISAFYINSSFDKWFSIRVQNTLQAALEITGTYYRNTEQSVLHFAEHISQSLSKHPQAKGFLLSPQRHPWEGFDAYPEWILPFLEGQRDLLGLDSIEFYANPYDDRLLVQNTEKADLQDLGLVFPRLPLDALNKAFSGNSYSLIQNVGTGSLVRSLVPLRIHVSSPSATSFAPAAGVIVVNAFIPIGVASKVDEIGKVLDDLKDTNPLKYPIKTAYFVILVMITLVIMFVAIWIGLYMARELTFPVERLVTGAKEVGAGNLDVEITASGHDEIAILIETFNRMTRDLRENRERLTQASGDLERRRLQLEAVLAHIETGVVAVDQSGLVSTFNPAAAKLLALDPSQVLGMSFDEAFKGSDHRPLQELIQKVQRSGEDGDSTLSFTEQWTFGGKAGGIQGRTLAAIATPLYPSSAVDATRTKGNWGAVLVIDDLTHLIKGQREMAWREVARRIAHEIKNPLTPIKLSAQRLQRKLSNLREKDGMLLKECTDTIIKHTDELKEMVNEFSNFARFPEVNPVLNDLNSVVQEVEALYRQAHPEITFSIQLETRLPSFEFDRDQIKRVLINLFDNAVFALATKAGPMKTISVASHYNDLLEMAAVEVKDNGPGIAEEVLNRIFEPYFSTKSQGTGLGLAIAKRIINDHDGFIRVQSNLGEGTLFLIELPTSLRSEGQGLAKGKRAWLDKS